MKNLVTPKITETSQKKCKSGIILPPMSQDTVSRGFRNISIFRIFHVRCVWLQFSRQYLLVLIVLLQFHRINTPLRR